MNVFELFGTIAIDQSGAERSLDKTVKHAKDTESQLEKTFKRIGGYVAAAFSVSAVVNFGKTCTQVYASVAAEESAFAQIMGDYADTANAKLNAVADQTGITATRMTGAMTSLTAKFKGLGYSTEDATTLAADGLLIAADAAAFWDMSLDESMSHLNSFINGSYEGGEAIGLFANDTQMAAYAIEKGFVADAKAWAALDEATKQAIRLSYAKEMMEQSGATGQAAKEAGAYANVLANLQESWRQFQAVIGKPVLEKFVLPAMQKLLNFMPILTESVQNGINWLDAGFDKIASYFTEVFTEDGLNMEALPNALKNMFRDVARKIPELLSNIGRTARNVWTGTVWPAVQSAFKVLLGIDLPEWSEIESAVMNWWDGGNGIKAAIAAACNWTLNLFGKPADVTQEDVSNVLDSWWSNTVTFVQNVCAWTLNLFNNPEETMEQVRAKIGEWWSTAKTWVTSACTWVLNLFANPEETMEQVKAKIGEWWTTAKTWVASACTWVLNLFTNPAETMEQVKAKIGVWWASAKAWVASACTWVLNLFGVPEETQEQIQAKIGTWWTAAKEWVTAACSWTLQMFGLPAGDPVQVVKDWWEGIRADIEAALDIDLSSIDVAGIFAAAGTAIDDVIAAAKTFYTNIVNAIALDEEGETNLNTVLSGLFDAAVQAMVDLCTAASTLVSSIVGSITGDEEGAKKIGGVFSDLFGWAGEIVTNFKNDALAVFDWLADNGELVAAAIGAIAMSTAKFILATPAMAAIAGLIALIGIMSTDWENFEQNHPELVSMFEELTGLDFTNVANSLDAFKDSLESVFTYFAEHEDQLQLLMTVAGAAIITKHPAAGIGLLTAAGVMGHNALESAVSEAKAATHKLANKSESGEYDEGLASKESLSETATSRKLKYGEGSAFADAFNRMFENLRNQQESSHSGGSGRFGEDDEKFDWNEANEALWGAWGDNNHGGGGSRRFGEDDSTEGYDSGGGGGRIEEMDQNTDATGYPVGLSSLLTHWQDQLTQSTQDITAAVQEGIAAGLSNVTITANIETGNVVLDTGTIAGAVTPRVNVKLGTIGKLLSRG